ncbi:MAG: hypothetical protein OEL89_05075 [Candidatus Peregrinibacteria bacterium]|nr:hypothetical protein [Candidatus Peregrinibacteria bacterium]
MKIIQTPRFQSSKELFDFAKDVLQALNSNVNFSELIKLRVELENGLKNIEFALSPTQQANLIVVQSNLNSRIEKGAIRKISG